MSSLYPTIDSFSGQYRFLSNFFLCRVWYDGLDYPSVEHAYQAQKLSPDDRWIMRINGLARSPGKAKRLGAMAHRTQPNWSWDDWNSRKVQIMDSCLRSKFQDFHLGRKLLDTGDCDLVAGNTWGDTFWGVCDGVGDNMLGKLLMKIREDMRLSKP